MGAEPLLRVENLNVSFAGAAGRPICAVADVSFSIARGQTLVLLGESGSGKSLTSLALLRLLPPAAVWSARRILLDGTDLTALPEASMRNVRGGRIAMIFQEPQSSLNPVLTVGSQIGETLTRHAKLRGKARRARALELIDLVGLPHPARCYDAYPHHLSGGMKQRVMIAIALAGDPELLIADEPTTALDVTIQAQILDLLQRLQGDGRMAILFITHDLGVAAKMADEIAVMRAGQLVEHAGRAAFFANPVHPYSRSLFAALPRRDGGIGADSAARNAQVLLSVAELSVHFPIRRGLFKRVVDRVRAVDGVSLHLRAGETLAIVGESGSGKTTLGKSILQLIPATAGRIEFDGQNLHGLPPRALRRMRSRLQIVFQDPYASLNPRMKVGDIIAEGMQAQGIGHGPSDWRRRVDQLLEQVRLETAHKHRYPHEFSGGQRQRICIARALSVNPKLLICDEPTSALDLSVQSQILDLLRELQQRLGLAYLLITHNLAVVECVAHRVAVMYRGKIVEQGPAETILGAPQHGYTRSLLAAVPAIPLTL